MMGDYAAKVNESRRRQAEVEALLRVDPPFPPLSHAPLLTHSSGDNSDLSYSAHMAEYRKAEPEAETVRCAERCPSETCPHNSPHIWAKAQWRGGCASPCNQTVCGTCLPVPPSKPVPAPVQMMICPHADTCPESWCTNHRKKHVRSTDACGCLSPCDHYVKGTVCVPVPPSKPVPAPVREIDRAELQERIDHHREFARLCNLGEESPLYWLMANLEALADGKAIIKDTRPYPDLPDGEGERPGWSRCRVGLRTCTTPNIDCIDCQTFITLAADYCRDAGWTERR